MTLPNVVAKPKRMAKRLRRNNEKKGDQMHNHCKVIFGLMAFGGFAVKWN